MIVYKKRNLGFVKTGGSLGCLGLLFALFGLDQACSCLSRASVKPLRNLNRACSAFRDSERILGKRWAFVIVVVVVVIIVIIVVVIVVIVVIVVVVVVVVIVVVSSSSRSRSRSRSRGSSGQ